MCGQEIRAPRYEVLRYQALPWIGISPQHFLPPPGIEPGFRASEARVLSVELQGPKAMAGRYLLSAPLLFKYEDGSVYGGDDKGLSTCFANLPNDNTL